MPKKKRRFRSTQDRSTEATLSPREIWFQAANRTFRRIHRSSVKTVMDEGKDNVAFDGSTPMTGKLIEAWAITVIGNVNSDPSDMEVAQLILDNYFFDRYSVFGSSDIADREKGYNLSGEAYYTVKCFKASQRCPSLTVKIFRDYSLSPKTFTYVPEK